MSVLDATVKDISAISKLKHLKINYTFVTGHLQWTVVCIINNSDIFFNRPVHPKLAVLAILDAIRVDILRTKV